MPQHTSADDEDNLPRESPGRYLDGAAEVNDVVPEADPEVADVDDGVRVRGSGRRARRGTPELGPPRPSYSAGSAFKASARRALTERGYSTHLWVSLQYTPGLVGKGAPGLIGHMALPVTGWRSRRRFRRRSRSDAKHFPSFLSEATKPYPSAEHAASASEASTFEDLSTSGARACRLAPSDMRADACAAETGASVVVGKQRRVSVTRKRTSPRTERLRETNATVASREEDNDEDP